MNLPVAPIELTADTQTRSRFSIPEGYAAKHRFELVAWAVAAVALCVTAFAVWARPVRVDRVVVNRPTVNAKYVAASLRQRQVVDGGQLGLKQGTVCYFGANSSGVFVVCPA